MRFLKELNLVILGTFLYLTLVLNQRIISRNLQRELEDYKFPVYSTPFCPRNESEWNKRSAALNCNGTNGFTCLPNQQFTELLEFCYTQPRILIEAGTCLYLVKRVSKVNGYNCHHFRYGCHNVSFLSDRIFEYPGCISLGNGCFLAEPSCESGKFPYLYENGSIKVKQDSTIPYDYPQQSTEQIHTENTLTNVEETLKLIALLLGVFTPFCVIFVLGDFYSSDRRKFRICKRHGDVESSEVEKLAQSKKQHELIDNVPIDEESPLFQQKRVFGSHDVAEMEMFLYDYQHFDKKSERQEVKTLRSSVGKNKNMVSQGERNKSQEPKASYAKRPRRGQTETREPTTDAVTIDTRTPRLSLSPEDLDALTKSVADKVLAEIKPLLQHQESVSFHNMGLKRGNNAIASASNNVPASVPVPDCHMV